jgi:hypothetical protein
VASREHGGLSCSRQARNSIDASFANADVKERLNLVLASW